MANPIQELRRKLEKKYKDSTEIFPDFTTVRQIEVVPTGSTIIDAVTGLGGFPRGRLTEVYGGFSTGKTTLAVQGLSALQKEKRDAVGLYVDYEHAFDAGYAHNGLGLDLNPDRFIFVQPDYFEQGDQVIDSFVTEGLVDYVVIDSAAAMTPLIEMTGEIDDKEGGMGPLGTQARLMSRMLTRLTKKISKGRKPALVMINQTRARIDLKNPRKSGEQSAAGNAIRFYASVRLELENITGEGKDLSNAKATTDQMYTRNRVRVTCIKNKLAPPWMRGTFAIDYGKGVNNAASIGELAEQKLGLINSGGFYAYAGDTPETTIKGRGRDEFLHHVMTNHALFRELEKKVLDRMREEQATNLGIVNLTKGEAAKDNFEHEDSSTLVLTTGTGMPTEEVS